MKFTKNYDKLDRPLFTTIRKNTGVYKLGNMYKIQTPNYDFYAKVIGLSPITKIQITPTLANVDADCSRNQLIQKLEKWYGKKFDDYVLITLMVWEQ